MRRIDSFFPKKPRVSGPDDPERINNVLFNSTRVTGEPTTASLSNVPIEIKTENSQLIISTPIIAASVKVKEPHCSSMTPLSQSSVEVTTEPQYASNSSVCVDSTMMALPPPKDLATSLSSDKDTSRDIGHHIEKRPDDFTKRMLLENHWKPPKGYVFPHSVHTKCGKQVKRFVGHQHLDQYHWLVLSHKDQGLYCVYCALFFVGEHGGYQTNTSVKMLIKTPLQSFAKLTGQNGYLERHDNNKYHRDAVEAGKDFLRCYSKSNDVVNLVCTQRKMQAEENRSKLRSIVETVILCGRQNIPLRGHRDDGKMETDNFNDGNFRSLLRFRVAAGDKALQEHLQTAASNATYTSKTIQNEIINCCMNEIQEQIVKRVVNSGMYSIIFDETTDLSRIEQMSLSVRYVFHGQIREDFLCFVDAYASIRHEDIVNETGEERLTGVALAHMIEDILHSFSLDTTQCVGIGTDNCAVMTSVNPNHIGAVASLLLKMKNARRCPCFNHSLNNSLGKTCRVIPCRNAVETMKKTIQFCRASAKRTRVFQKVLGTAFTGLCETRWSERHDGILQFQNKLSQVMDALNEITSWVDKKTSSDAFCLKAALEKSEFVISLVVLCDVLGTTQQLSTLLQSESLDLDKASNALTDVLAILESHREKASEYFKELFTKAEVIAEEAMITITAPRTVVRQIHRANTPADHVEQYYLRSVYIPLLDYVISDLKDRLPKETLQCFGLSVFLPRFRSNSRETLDNVLPLAKTYKDFLGVPEGTECFKMKKEYEGWLQKWKREEKKGSPLPKTAMETLIHCDKDQFPLIQRMIQILATLPSSVATAERSFSTLRRVKTWMRTRINEERLTGLALLNVHRDIHVDVETIIERFAKQKARKLNFII